MLLSLTNKALPTSVHEQDGLTLWLTRESQQRFFHCVAPEGHKALSLFHGEGSSLPNDNIHLVTSCDSHNANALRQLVPNLIPQPLGLKTSVGFGDRLGLATPGHVRALQQVGGDIAPIFAQQSIREMARAKRTPDEVMTDATWGTLEGGYQGSVGADADHLKLPEHIDATLQAGFSFFTFDPGEHVDDRAETFDIRSLVSLFEQLPWRELESSEADFQTRYIGRKIDFGTYSLQLGSEAVLRAAVKYSRAVAHIVTMYRHLLTKKIPFDLEISVDETSYPTSPVEHIIIASELKRLGVKWQSLAPRFVGSFEKGIDYIGNLGELKENLEVHAAIARVLGPYKLSLHSGSDKFSVYPLAAEATNGLVHLKTAGTSYLSCDTSRIPANLPHSDLATLLDQRDARQVLHVTFGSVLETFKPDLLHVLTIYDEVYYDTLATHFEKHLKPFVR